MPRCYTTQPKVAYSIFSIMFLKDLIELRSYKAYLI